MASTTPAEASKPVSTVTPVTEGAATILFPSANEVFYNPIQQFNRDLSVLAIRAWSESFIEAKRTRFEQQQEKQAKRRKISGDAGEDIKLAAAAVDGLETTSLPETKSPQGKNDAESNTTDMYSSSDQVPEFKFTILEALSATGLRAIRYAKEIPNLACVIANDLSEAAVEQIRLNSEHNETTGLVRPNQGDARAVMYSTKKKFNVIDLDPYGSAAPFLDAAVQAVEDGGLMLVTCTDLAVLAGDAHVEKCYSHYGGVTLKQSEFCHEQALRMVVSAISSSAGRYGRAVTPLLCLSIDFYVRLFVRVDNSPARVKHLLPNTMLTYQCSGCKTFTNQPLGHAKQGTRPELFKFQNATLGADRRCPECGESQHVGGPMYAGALHDHAFIDRVLRLAGEAEASPETNVFGTIPRIKGMLSVAKEELDVPHHWSISRMTKVLHCQSPPTERMLSALLNAGHRVSGSHTGPTFIKTDAPASFMWDMLREWIKTNPIREESIKPGTAGAAILARREPRHAIDFTPHPGARLATKRQGLVRYQLNPTVNWGPKQAAKGGGVKSKKRKADTATQGGNAVET